jgi:hypothetical protein
MTIRDRPGNPDAGKEPLIPARARHTVLDVAKTIGSVGQKRSDPVGQNESDLGDR